MKSNACTIGLQARYTHFTTREMTLNIQEYTPNAPTRRRLTDIQKVEHILAELGKHRLSLSRFLFVLLELKDNNGKSIPRSKPHEQAVVAMLNGSSKPTFGKILELCYANAVKVGYREDDRTVPKNQNFTTGAEAQDIEHAYPAMNAWAVEMAARMMESEAKGMVKKEDYHLQASSKAEVVRRSPPEGVTRCEQPAAIVVVTERAPAGAERAGEEEGQAEERVEDSDRAAELEVPDRAVEMEQRVAEVEERTMEDGMRDPEKPDSEAEAKKTAVVTWERLNAFSYSGMQDTLRRDAPVSWHLLNTYANATYNRGGSAMVVRRYRPQPSVSMNNDRAVGIQSTHPSLVCRSLPRIWHRSCSAGVTGQISTPSCVVYGCMARRPISQSSASSRVWRSRFLTRRFVRRYTACPRESWTHCGKLCWRTCFAFMTCAGTISKHT